MKKYIKAGLIILVMSITTLAVGCERSGSDGSATKEESFLSDAEGTYEYTKDDSTETVVIDASTVDYTQDDGNTKSLHIKEASPGSRQITVSGLSDKIKVKKNDTIKFKGHTFEKVAVDESGSSGLTVTETTIKNDSDQTVCTGTLKNTGDETYRFIKVKGSFKNADGEVIDTDSTYAVGDEGLAPGESTTFQMSVTKNNSIKSCDATVYSYI